MNYDYLIVGAGLFGSTFAHELTKAGKKCLVIDKRSHIAGNCFTEERDNINIHTYGPHIFHTNDTEIWKWINQFCEFNNYQHKVKVNFREKIYSFPINLLTFSQLWGVKNPKEAIERLEKEKISKQDPRNLEDWILSEVGRDIYSTFFEGYTRKQWNKNPKDLPSSIIKRLPIRITFDDNYFSDQHQGIPKGGYTKIFEKILDGIEVRLNVDYFSDRNYWNQVAKKVVFTGKIDEFFDYKFGELQYRTLKFETIRLDMKDFQGCSIMNYTDINVPYTRICEHKHFEGSKSDVTWITKEYSSEYNKGDIPYYPINDDYNNKIYNQYKNLSKEYPNVIFGGRLAEYKYYDMHQVIGSALSKVRKEILDR
jgi:UDP-galactopyranose mutase